jgi:surfactin family lipopeptide synthetase C
LDLARSRQLTLSTIIQGAWALLLGRYSGRDDVVFGLTVSGRPAELADVESMVGMFINTLPLRVAVDEHSGLVPWLRAIQRRQFELRQFEHSALVQVQGWSDVPRGRPLFESIVVVENYPVDAALAGRAERLGVEAVRSLDQTNYPLDLTVVPGEELWLKIGYDAHRFEADAIDRLLGHLNTLLEGIAADPDRCLADLPMLTGAERDQLLRRWNDTRSGFAGKDGLPLPADLDRLPEEELDHWIEYLRSSGGDLLR